MVDMVIGLMSLVPGAGKDTLAAYLVSTQGFTRIAYGDALYQEAAAAFGVSVEFLGNRETKETPLDDLCLANCHDSRFVQQMLEVHDGEEHPMSRPRSPRWILQNWGTEYRRALFGDTYWLDRVDAKIAQAGGNVVVTDVRFPNEIAHVRTLGGALVRVRRLDLEEEVKDSPAIQHASQTQIRDFTADVEVVNIEGRPEEMFEALKRQLLSKAS